MQGDSASQAERDTDSLLRFAVLPYQFCVPAVQVQAIIIPPRLTVLPMSHVDVAGIFMYQGEVVSCIDMRRRFSLPPRPAGNPGQLLLGRVDGTLFAFWVDEVSDIITSDTMTWSALPGRHRYVFNGCFLKDEDIILATSMEQLFNCGREDVNTFLQDLVNEDIDERLRKQASNLAAAQHVDKQRADEQRVDGQPVDDPQDSTTVQLHDAFNRVSSLARDSKPAAEDSTLPFVADVPEGTEAKADDETDSHADVSDSADSSAEINASSQDPAGLRPGSGTEGGDNGSIADGNGSTATATPAFNTGGTDRHVTASRGNDTFPVTGEAARQTGDAHTASPSSSVSATSANPFPAVEHTDSHPAPHGSTVFDHEADEINPASAFSSKHLNAAKTTPSGSPSVPSGSGSSQLTKHSSDRPDSSHQTPEAGRSETFTNRATSAPDYPHHPDHQARESGAVHARQSGSQTAFKPDSDQGAHENNRTTIINRSVMGGASVAADSPAGVHQASPASQRVSSARAGVLWLLLLVGILFLVAWLWSSSTSDSSDGPRSDGLGSETEQPSRPVTMEPGEPGPMQFQEQSPEPVVPVAQPEPQMEPGPEQFQGQSQEPVIQTAQPETVIPEPQSKPPHRQEILRIEEDDLRFRVERRVGVDRPDAETVMPLAGTDAGVESVQQPGEMSEVPTVTGSMSDRAADDATPIHSPVSAEPQGFPGKTVNASGSPASIRHIVVSGDTLWDIAKKYLDDPWRYPQLAQLSRIDDPDLIYPGDIVIIEFLGPESR